MSINRSEFLTVKKYVTDDLSGLCLFDAIAEAVVPAYEEIFGTPMLPADSEEQLARIDRLSTYAVHWLVEMDPSFASHEVDDRACRNLDNFDRIDVQTYSAEFFDGTKIEITTDFCGTWTAIEYDSDGDISHVGKGDSAQDALNAMRLIVPDDFLAA